ncbi:T9SS type A sorting domain-containing protein [Pedobacter alpinus]|uniref:T9SS type A sorting domain-containing protein n=1 Tax=Pedobacter alpinus TaxID=1590643 RepID=A0ABW5TQ60_9SPHI
MKKRYYLFNLFLLLFCYNLKAQTWQPIGPDPLNEASLERRVKFPKLKVNNNIPYVAFSNGFLAQKATVRRLVNNKWENFGPINFSAGIAKHIDLDFIGTTPVVAYSDGNKSNKATVQQFNNTSSTWDTVGTAGFSAGAATEISLTIINNTPYIAYVDGGNSNQATVQKYNSTTTSWELVGTAGFSTEGTSISFIKIISDGTNPYVAYINNNSKPIIRKFDGTTWQTLTSIDSQNDFFSYGIDLAFADNTVYVLYSDNFYSTGNATVKKYNSSLNQWQVVGTEGFSASDVSDLNLAFNGGTPYVAYSEIDGGYFPRATVQKFDGTSWGLVGPAKITPENFYATDLSLGIVDNVPYIAYEDYSYESKLAVQKFNSTSWEYVGSRPLSQDAQFLSIGLAADATPYAAFSGYENDNKTTIKKFNGTKWEVVGTTEFSPLDAGRPQIAFNGNVPYVAFHGGEASGKVGVKIYNTALSQWDFVGPAGFGENPNLIRFVIDNATPFICYEAISGLVYVKKYNMVANQWESLGTAGISSGTAYYASLAVLNNVPYVAFTDIALGEKVFVKKYNSVTNLWEQVGTDAISSARSLSAKLTFNGTDLYLAYNNAGDRKAVVKKYNSTLNQWDLVGSAGISVGAAYEIDLVFVNNMPCIAYLDGGAGQNSFVKKFDGTNWVSLGIPRDGQPYTPSNLALAVNGDNLIAAYGSNLYVERFSLATVLPVKLVSFEASSKNEKQVSLTWQTASEKSNNYFTLSKSQDGKTFEKLVNVNSKGDNGANYSTIDFSPFAGTSYYKLSQTDVDGKTEELGIRIVKLGGLKENSLSVYPNPIKDGVVHIQNANLNGEQTVSVYDLSGKKLISNKLNFSNELAIFKIGKELPKGIYILSIANQYKTQIVVD